MFLNQRMPKIPRNGETKKLAFWYMYVLMSHQTVPSLSSCVVLHEPHCSFRQLKQGKEKCQKQKDIEEHDQNTM